MGEVVLHGGMGQEGTDQRELRTPREVARVTLPRMPADLVNKQSRKDT